MVGRHFMDEDELVQYLTKNSDFDADQGARRWSSRCAARLQPAPPQRILEWQAQQDFPICPGGDDPDACNVYRNLKFPDGVYENIQEYHEQKAGAFDGSAENMSGSGYDPRR